MTIPTAPVERAAAPISFVRLGPFYRLQLRVGLLNDGDLAAGRRALIFVALAWLPCLVLAIVEGRALGPHGMAGDFSAYAFALALAAFVLMEQSSDARMTSLVEQFTARGIARESAREGLSRARRNMERRTGAWAAEAALVVPAYLLSHAWMVRAAQGAEDGAWIGRLAADGGLMPSLAGWWVLLVALPLYWFLFGRWLWRFLTWGWMLRDLARCDLQLVATHPDRCGGLAFIGQYPKTYVMFVFAVSTVVASTVLKMVIHGGASLLSFKFALFGMIAFFAITFVVPLFAFTPMLVALKRAGLVRYGALLSQHDLAFGARWLDAPEGGAGLLGNPDASSLADLAAAYDRVKDMRSAPVTKESVVPIVLAALAPMAGVAATQVPVSQILAAVKGLLML